MLLRGGQLPPPRAARPVSALVAARRSPAASSAAAVPGRRRCPSGPRARTGPHVRTRRRARPIGLGRHGNGAGRFNPASGLDHQLRAERGYIGLRRPFRRLQEPDRSRPGRRSVISSHQTGRRRNRTDTGRRHLSYRRSWMPASHDQAVIALGGRSPDLSCAALVGSICVRLMRPLWPSAAKLWHVFGTAGRRRPSRADLCRTTRHLPRSAPAAHRDDRPAGQIGDMHVRHRVGYHAPSLPRRCSSAGRAAVL
jgi:hypothetical protein